MNDKAIQTLNDIRRLFHENELNAALEMAEAAIRLYPSEPEGYFLCAEIYRKKGGHGDKILEYLNEAYLLNPNKIQYVGRLAEQCRIEGKLELAIGYYQEILTREPLNWAYIGLGNALERKGDAHLAALYFQKAIDLNPDKSDDLRGRLDKIRLRLRDSLTVVDGYRKLLPKCVSSNQFFCINKLIASMYSGICELDEAAHFYQEAAQLYARLLTDYGIEAEQVVHPGLTQAVREGKYGCVSTINEEGIRGWFFDIGGQNSGTELTLSFNNNKLATVVPEHIEPYVSAIHGYPVRCGFYLQWADVCLDGQFNRPEKNAKHPLICQVSGTNCYLLVMGEPVDFELLRAWIAFDGMAHPETLSYNTEDGDSNGLAQSKAASDGIVADKEFSSAPLFAPKYHLDNHPDVQGKQGGGRGHLWLSRNMSTEAMASNFWVEQKLVVLVLGMHRSGTSVLTKVISLLGADLPSHLMAANSGNEMGYWESQDLANIHDRILSLFGSRWDDPLPIDLDKLPAETIDYAKTLLAEYIVRDFSASQCFVVKDPRICLLIPLWLDVLDSLNVQIKIVLPFRHPLEVARSLQKRDGGGLLQKSFLLWLRYVLTAERQTRGLKRCFVGYSHLLANYQEVIGAIAKQCQIDWIMAPDTDAQIAEFIDGQYYHQRITEADVNDAGISGWVLQVYGILQEWSGTSGDGQALQDKLDAINEALAQADKLYGNIIREKNHDLQYLFAAHQQAKKQSQQLADQLSQLFEWGGDFERMARQNNGV